jgi:hypothetical protein
MVVQPSRRLYVDYSRRVKCSRVFLRGFETWGEVFVPSWRHALTSHSAVYWMGSRANDVFAGNQFSPAYLNPFEILRPMHVKERRYGVVTVLPWSIHA